MIWLVSGGFWGVVSTGFRLFLVLVSRKDWPCCQLKVISRSKCRLNTLFWFEDPFEKKIRSGIIYHYTCNSKVTHYGKNFCHIYTRVAEHMRISNLTGKHLKNVKQSAVFDHLLQCNCAIDSDCVMTSGF